MKFILISLISLVLIAGTEPLYRHSLFDYSLTSIANIQEEASETKINFYKYVTSHALRQESNYLFFALALC